MISIGRKLFDEVDTPVQSKIVSEDSINKIAERESSWTAEINGIDPFPSGKASGSGSSMIHSNGISISSWQGKFTTRNREVITFNGRDVNKNGEFIVLRTYFTDSLELSWINGLVCLVNGEFDSQEKVFRCEGYEFM